MLDFLSNIAKLITKTCLITVAIILTTFLSFSVINNASNPKTFIEVLPDDDGQINKLNKNKNTIAILDINGAIPNKYLSSEIVEEQLRNISISINTNKIKGLILHIESPGGSPQEAKEISRHINNFREKFNIPVYAFSGHLCASAGYHIAINADKIFTDFFTSIGSVGVLAKTYNLHTLLNKLGVDFLTSTAGKNKDLLNPTREWTSEEKGILRNKVNWMYEIFVTDVANKRPLLTVEKLKNIGANVFFGPEAFELGLSDGFGYSIKDIVKMIAKDFSIENYQVISTYPTINTMAIFSSESPLVTGKIKLSLDQPTLTYE